MMIRLILSFFRPFKWFIEKMGADYNQFIRILQLKLTLDNRSPKGLNRSPEKAQENMLIKQTLGYLAFGALFGIFLSIIRSQFTFYYFAHIFLMVMMAISIISEFTTILFDTSENVIIQPLPVKGNTVNLARNAHVFTYLTLMAFSISIIWIIIALFRFGPVSALIFIFTIFLNILFTLFLANILYLGIMRLASGERLKNILMYFQIVIAILFMGGYQFGMKLVDTTNIKDMVLPVHWYTFLVPPAYFSGIIESLATLNFDLSHLIFIAEALLLPLIAIYFTGKFLTPVFNRKLMDLEQGDRNSHVRSEKAGISLWYRIMSTLFVFNNEEKASFRLMWKMTGRERLFKQTFFPSIGYIVILIVVQYVRKPVPYKQLVEGNFYLFSLYILLFIAATLPQSLLIGNNSQATWIFKTVPLGSPANFFKGCIKATFAKFFIPFYLFAGTAICAIWGFRVIPDVIIGFMVTYLFTTVYYYFQTPAFPFTMEKSATQSGLTMIKIFTIMALAGAAGFLHNFLLHNYQYANLILIPFYTGMTLYVNRILVYKRIRWATVDRVNVY
jgi:ABC-2 type transport system permease protein